jgi:hypothetical protein
MVRLGMGRTRSRVGLYLVQEMVHGKTRSRTGIGLMQDLV